MNREYQGEISREDAELPLKLVQANIALFKGERAELLRLLEEYRAQSGRGSHDPYYTLLLWLEAQAQNDQDARLEQLRALVALEREDIYTSLAREILHDEETYSAKLAQVERGRRRAIRLTLLLGAAGVILLIVVLALGLLSGNEEAAPESILNSTPTTAPSPTPTPLPDRSRPLNSENFTKRYLGGILQVSAAEIGSERVINAQQQLISPVAGAQFIALKLIFECRSGICNTPPEANLALQLDNGEIIPVREDVSIAGETPFQPIALGHTTTGWVVFEIPVIGIADALVITPLQDQTLRETIPLQLE